MFCCWLKSTEVKTENGCCLPNSVVMFRIFTSWLLTVIDFFIFIIILCYYFSRDFDFYRFPISIDINRRIKSIDFRYRFLSINYFSSVSSSFWTCFSNWWHEKLIKNWLYLKALLSTVGTKSPITGKCLITVWLSPNIMFLLQAYATASMDFDSFLLRLSNKIDILRTIAFWSKCLSQFKKTWAKLL